MDDSGNVKKTKRKPPNLKHGAAGAVKALTRGEEFTGLPALREGEVRNELETEGRAGLVLTRTVRIQTAADLYFDAAIAAMQNGNQALADGYFKQYAWLQGKAMAAWTQVAADEKDAAKGGNVTAIDVLNSIKRSKENADKPE